jgi:hypothetical protein
MSASISGTNLQATRMVRPMRQYPPATIRPPDLANIPLVVSATGLGSGGGAGVGGNADSAWGQLRVFVGLAPSASGTIVLQWPVAPPAAAGGIFCAADWASLVVTQGNPLTIAWTATQPLVQSFRPLLLAYEWNVSR